MEPTKWAITFVESFYSNVCTLFNSKFFKFFFVSKLVGLCCCRPVVSKTKVVTNCFDMFYLNKKLMDENVFLF